MYDLIRHACDEAADRVERRTRRRLLDRVAEVLRESRAETREALRVRVAKEVRNMLSVGGSWGDPGNSGPEDGA